MSQYEHDDAGSLTGEPVIVEIEIDGEPQLPEHLFPLHDGRWALWRWVGLRGAGFPSAYVRALAAPTCGAAADQLIEADDELQQAYQAAQELLNRAMDALRRENAWGDVARREPLVRAARQLKQGKRPVPQGLPGDATAALDAWYTAHTTAGTARAAFHQAFQDAADAIAASAREIALSNRFREAIIWQNRQAFHSGIASLLRKQAESSGGSKHRQHIEMLASYVQRYCVKNDTIGFFGPVGWARIVPEAGAAITARPGADLLALRTVYFENWCISALADALAENKALLPWIPPRRMPSVYIDGTTAYVRYGTPIKLAADQLALLQMCDGTRTAHMIAAEYLRTNAGSLRDELQVYNILRLLHDRGLIAWKLEPPFESRPERSLRQMFGRIGDPLIRGQVLGALNELEGARSAVAEAAGDSEKLDQALLGLEATFTRLTGAVATRSLGQMYAGRTLVYEETRRDIDVELGPAIVEALSPPLTLLLSSVRWFTYEVARAYRASFKETFAELAREAGTPVVNLADFWTRVQPELNDDHTSLADRVVALFQDRWADVLGISGDGQPCDFTSEELRPRVQAAFDAPAPGWVSAHHHSPDVMIAASSVEAIQRGEYLFVMGELHPGVNTLSASLFLSQHPSPAELFLAIELDLPEARLVPVVSQHWKKLTTRTRPALVSPYDYRLIMAADSGSIPKSKAIAIGELVVAEVDGEVIVRSRDGRLTFDIVDTFSLMLSTLALKSFGILRPRRHQPRITIDRLVIHRESWSFSPAECFFAFEKDGIDRFIAARRWARAQGIPGRAFVKSPVEVKPLYVDFDSPTYVDIFAKVVRRTLDKGQGDALIAVSEMLPDLEQLWLPDADGQRYTGELRLVAVDLGAYDRDESDEQV